MQTVDISGTQIIWRPPLVQLTDPIDGSPVFMHPDQIQGIRRGIAKGPDNTDIEVTFVLAGCLSHHMLVKESPEEVARLRNEAFGIVPPSTPQNTKRLKAIP